MVSKVKHFRRYLAVRDIKTDEIVHRVDVSGRSESQVERVELGMLMRIDTDRFYVDYIEEEVK